MQSSDTAHSTALTEPASTASQRGRPRPSRQRNPARNERLTILRQPMQRAGMKTAIQQNATQNTPSSRKILRFPDKERRRVNKKLTKFTYTFSVCKHRHPWTVQRNNPGLCWQLQVNPHSLHHTVTMIPWNGLCSLRSLNVYWFHEPVLQNF